MKPAKQNTRKSILTHFGLKPNQYPTPETPERGRDPTNPKPTCRAATRGLYKTDTVVIWFAHMSSGQNDGISPRGHGTIGWKLAPDVLMSSSFPKQQNYQYVLWVLAPNLGHLVWTKRNTFRPRKGWIKHKNLRPQKGWNTILSDPKKVKLSFRRRAPQIFTRLQRLIEATAEAQVLQAAGQSKLLGSYGGVPLVKMIPAQPRLGPPVERIE